MRRLVYQIYIGEPSKLYDWCIDSVANYCEERGYVHVVQHDPILKICCDYDNPKCSRSKEATAKHGGFLPILEKFNALRYFHTEEYGAFDQIALIDADVWVREGAPCVFTAAGKSDFAAVVERDLPSTNAHRKKCHGYSRLFGNLKDVNWEWANGMAGWFNCGVEVLGGEFPSYIGGQKPEEFLARPEFKRFIDGEGYWKWATEQVLMNWFVRKSGMELRKLDWKWNCLYGAVHPSKCKESWFVHFYLRDHLPGRGEDTRKLETQIR